MPNVFFEWHILRAKTISEVGGEAGLDGELQKAAFWTSVAATETRQTRQRGSEGGCSAGKATGCAEHILP